MRASASNDALHVIDDDNFYITWIERIRSATNGNVVLGNKRFEEQITKMLRRRVTRGKAGRPARAAA